VTTNYDNQPISRPVSSLTTATLGPC